MLRSYHNLRLSRLRLVALLVLSPLGAATAAGSEAATRAPLEIRRAILQTASRLLDEAQISYVYGGYQVGDSDDCRRCNDCLGEKSPAPKARLKECKVCSRCSLDCSHFAEMVFREAGAPYPYADTATLLALSSEALRRRYGLVDRGRQLDGAAPGDLLVYDGHMVVLERTHAPVEGSARFRGDIVHATGGRDIKRPGEGIQRERFVDLASFRGPLLRVLRHRALAAEGVAAAVAPEASKALPAKAPARALRPVPKRTEPVVP